MCAIDYFRSRQEADILSRHYLRQLLKGIEERAHFPGQDREVIRIDPDGNPYVTYARWGLVPGWAKNPKDVGNTYNARDDSLIMGKPTFKRGFASRRCLLVGTSFIEHCDRIVPKSSPVEFAIGDDEPYFYAGLWDSWGKDDAYFESCTMITTEPNALVSPVHSRMPVILRDEAEYDAWLNPNTPREELLELLRPYPHENMSMRPANLPTRTKKVKAPEAVIELIEEAPLQDSLF